MRRHYLVPVGVFAAIGLLVTALVAVLLVHQPTGGTISAPTPVENAESLAARTYASDLARALESSVSSGEIPPGSDDYLPFATATLNALRSVTPTDAAKWEHADLTRDIENYTKRYSGPGAFDDPSTDRFSDLRQTAITAYEDCLDIREIIQSSSVDSDIPCDDGRLGVLFQCADGLKGFDEPARSWDALRSSAEKAYGASLPMPNGMPADANFAWSSGDLAPPAFVDDPRRKEHHVVKWGKLHRSVNVLVAPAGQASRVQITYAPRPTCMGPSGTTILAADGTRLSVSSGRRGERSIVVRRTPEATTYFELATVQFVAAGVSVAVEAEFDYPAPGRDVQRSVVVEWANRILASAAPH